MTQRIIEITSPVFLPVENIPEGGISDAFAQKRPLALEIGCGIGDFIVQLAAQNPAVNYLAIDIYNKGCLKTCKKVEAAGLDNVRVARAEARFLMSHHLAPESLSAIYVNCPDPWPKKRHRRRRLVNPEFLSLALHYLQPGGDFHFSTDFPDYAESVAEDLGGHGGYRNCLPAPLVLERPGYPLSKYMRRFLEQGQPIHFIHHRKREDLRPETQPLPAIGPGFRIRWSSAGNE